MRAQIVKVIRKTSALLHTTIGVPQGYIPGPVLFILCINDLFYLTSNIQERLLLYTDDNIYMLLFDHNEEAIATIMKFIVITYN